LLFPASALLLLLLQAGVITDLVLLWTVGIRPVLVHGGGPEINSWLGKLGIQPEFKGGLRVTDGEMC
jgi:acetylglutamate kinase